MRIGRVHRACEQDVGTKATVKHLNFRMCASRKWRMGLNMGITVVPLVSVLQTRSSMKVVVHSNSDKSNMIIQSCITAWEYQGCESLCEIKSEIIWNAWKRSGFQCIKSLKMGFCEEQKVSEIRLKSEFSHPWNTILPYFGKRKQVTKVTFLVKEQNVSVICSNVNRISCLT